ncbi:hypothetical protein HGA15_07145 [Nocardia flavorosea]|uniref:TAP-like protein n=1 Tax=Nocardia flavorosea TaxID=53429 RepID=A0A846YFK8_9NOCA|nr:hypothetical protein [Nocardia flavorosea]
MLGATYAHLYPENLRAMVRDGLLDHDLPARRLAADQVHSSEEVFGGFAEWCRYDTTCALHDRDVRAVYGGLLDRVEQHPIPATDDADGFTATEIGMGAYQLVVFRENWPDLAQAIEAADRGDAVEFAKSPFTSPAQAAYRAITCLGYPTDVRGYPDLDPRIDTAVRAAPTTRGHVEAWDVQIGCFGLPIPGTNPPGPTPVEGTPPVLIVAGEHDPQPVPMG